LETFFGLQKKLIAPEEKLMSTRTAAASVEKSLPVETIEAEINSLIEQQTPKRIAVEQQTPTRVEIEDDAERSRSFVARITSTSKDGLHPVPKTPS
jgi:hypothetical protein